MSESSAFLSAMDQAVKDTAKAGRMWAWSKGFFFGLLVGAVATMTLVSR